MYISINGTRSNWPERIHLKSAAYSYIKLKKTNAWVSRGMQLLEQKNRSANLEKKVPMKKIQVLGK